MLGRLNTFDLSVTMALKKFMIIFVVCPQICVFVFLCNHQTVDCRHIVQGVCWLSADINPRYCTLILNKYNI